MKSFFRPGAIKMGKVKRALKEVSEKKRRCKPKKKGGGDNIKKSGSEKGKGKEEARLKRKDNTRGDGRRFSIYPGRVREKAINAFDQGNRRRESWTLKGGESKVRGKGSTAGGRGKFSQAEETRGGKRTNER